MENVPSITSVGRSRDQDVSSRAMQYTIMMAIRVGCFFAAVLTEGWLRWTFAAGAVLLPYFAVVIANAGRRRSRGDTSHLIDTTALPTAPSAAASVTEPAPRSDEDGRA